MRGQGMYACDMVIVVYVYVYIYIRDMLYDVMCRGALPLCAFSVHGDNTMYVSNSNLFKSLIVAD